MDKILITGGAGLIGLPLTEKLVKAGYHVVCFDLAEQFVRREAVFTELKKLGKLEIVVGTIMDRWSVSCAMSGAKAVFHLAAMLGVQRTEDNRLRCMDINVNGTDKVITACVENGVEHVIVASSSEVYGEPSSNPISEKAETKGKTVYAVSKMGAEELTKGYNQINENLDYTIVRFFNTYGENQVAQFVLSKWIKRVLEGKNPVVYGTGEQTRSYGHVDDATNGLQLILEDPNARNKVFNIGNSSQIFTLKDAAQKVIDVLRPDGDLSVDIVDFDQSDRIPEREIHHRYCDTTYAETELGYKAKIDLEEGIKRIAGAGPIHDNWAHGF